jgi:hypothetical protein
LILETVGPKDAFDAADVLKWTVCHGLKVALHRTAPEDSITQKSAHILQTICRVVLSVQWYQYSADKNLVTGPVIQIVESDLVSCSWTIKGR